MTSEERIAQLEAALALERAKVAELTTTLEHVAKNATAADAARARTLEEEARSKALRRERNKRYRDARRIGDARETSSETSSPPSPPLDGSPLSSEPSLPSPLSSPHPVSSSKEPQAVPEREELRLTSPTSKRKQRKPSEAEELFATMQGTRVAKCEEAEEAVIPERWDFAKQNKLLGPVVRDTEAAQGLFERAWGLYLADDGQRIREPAWSLSWFMMVRAQYETRAAREAAEGEAA